MDFVWLHRCSWFSKKLFNGASRSFIDVHSISYILKIRLIDVQSTFNEFEIIHIYVQRLPNISEPLFLNCPSIVLKSFGPCSIDSYRVSLDVLCVWIDFERFLKFVHGRSCIFKDFHKFQQVSHESTRMYIDVYHFFINVQRCVIDSRLISNAFKSCFKILIDV